jgi:hypothetical protein
MFLHHGCDGSELLDSEGDMTPEELKEAITAQEALVVLLVKLHQEQLKKLRNLERELGGIK